MINVVQTQLFKSLKPELAKLDDVIGVRLILLEYGADNGGDTQHAEHAHGKAHGAEQLVQP